MMQDSEVLTAASPLASDVTGWPVVIASLSLVAVSIALAWLIGVRVERQMIAACARAAVQLLGVGVIFVAIFDSSHATAGAWLWLAFMVVVAVVVIVRRAQHKIEHLVLVASTAVLCSVAASVLVVFGFGVFEFDPVALVAIAGITIGNAVPSAVLGVNQSVATCRDRIGEIEAALSSGFDRRQVMRFVAPRAARSGLIPQIERTKVVGLIALPGAMTGLLLAGVDPVDAVIVQLLVMYLVLGATAICVVAVVAAVTSAAVTGDLRVADWVRPETMPTRPSVNLRP